MMSRISTTAPALTYICDRPYARVLADLPMRRGTDCSIQQTNHRVVVSVLPVVPLPVEKPHHNRCTSLG